MTLKTYFIWRQPPSGIWEKIGEVTTANRAEVVAFIGDQDGRRLSDVEYVYEFTLTDAPPASDAPRNDTERVMDKLGYGKGWR